MRIAPNMAVAARSGRPTESRGALRRYVPYALMHPPQAALPVLTPWPGALSRGCKRNVPTKIQARSAADWHFALERGPAGQLDKTAAATGQLLLELLADDALLELSGCSSLRTCAFLRATCRRLRLLIPRPHVSWLDSCAVPLWEPGRARGQ